MTTLYCPDLLFSGGRFSAGMGLLVDDAGLVLASGPCSELSADTRVVMKGQALVPGLVNAHSHSFQRLIRGRAESRATSGKDFWSWRGTMYHAAARLSLGDIYDVARMAFLEMVLSGITTVGEFHYLHNAPDGRPYDDANASAKQIMDAAMSVGIRMVLLRSAYFRAGFGLDPDPGQARFYESPDDFLSHLEALSVDERFKRAATVHLGVAPHSLRAVPLGDLCVIAEWSRAHSLPLHMHVSEQRAENAACVKEYGATPIELLAREGILRPEFTAVHAIHVTEREEDEMAAAGAGICACPATERNLGDGILQAHRVMAKKINVCLGTDSQAQVDLLEDARELDYHLRLQQEERAVLDQIGGVGLAARLFGCASVNGARALGERRGLFAAGSPADFFTVNLREVALAGHTADDLLSRMVFSLERTAIADVVVQGRQIVSDGAHRLQEEIVERYLEVDRRTWERRRD